MIAASAAGGNPDVMARLLANRLSEVFKNPFIVEDVPGVGGVIAAKRVAAATPDGYTLMLNDSGALAISIVTNPDADYRLEDFTPITALASLPTVLVIKPSVPANTLSEFVALAKSKPGAMSFGSAGAGSIHQLTMVMFEQRAGIELLHVPYRGGTGLVNALLDWRSRFRLVRHRQRSVADPDRQIAGALSQRVAARSFAARCADV